MLIRLIISCICVLGILSAGCTALNTFPNAARSGDTITLAVGSPDGMTRANTTATFAPDANLDKIPDVTPVDITPSIKSIFKLYADRASSVYQFGSTTGSLTNSAGHEPWLTVVALDLVAPDLPLGLPVGPGIIQFDTTATYPGIGSHINDVPISIEILPGTGSSANFDYELGIGATETGDLTALEALPRAEFGPEYPSPSCPCPSYGAIEVKVNMPTSFGPVLTSTFMRVLLDDMTPDTGSGRGMSYGLVNGQDLTVMITSLSGALKYQEARFSIVLHSVVSFSGTPTITSIRYFGLDGLELSGPVTDYTAALY